MEPASRFELDARTIGLSAVSGAAVTVATLAMFPFGVGYLNFGEVVIYTVAFLFGGTVGGLAGGVGAAAADMILAPFSIFAPITLVAKGLEGYVVGRLAGESLRSKAIAVAAGAPFMIGGYVIAVAVLFGPPAAGPELAIDIVQAVVGFAVAVPLTKLLEDRIPELR
jgi:uncharacterized membrane protein